MDAVRCNSALFFPSEMEVLSTPHVGDAFADECMLGKVTLYHSSFKYLIRGRPVGLLCRGELIHPGVQKRMKRNIVKPSGCSSTTGGSLTDSTRERVSRCDTVSVRAKASGCAVKLADCTVPDGKPPLYARKRKAP